MAKQNSAIEQFGGLKNNEDVKQVSLDYFVDMRNYDVPVVGTKGLDTVKYPSPKYSYETASKLSGLYGYIETPFGYNLSIGIEPSVWYGRVYIHKTTDSPASYLNYYDDWSTNWNILTSYAIYNDKVFLDNGKIVDLNVRRSDGRFGIIYDMGAPYVSTYSLSAGLLNSTYFYECVFVTAAGDEVTGSRSNYITVVNKQVVVNLPIGYSGTTSRKLYRTDTATGKIQLLATIADNTTLTYADNTASGGVVSSLTPNNPLPKGYVKAFAGKLYVGNTSANYPTTQLFFTEPGLECIDGAEDFLEVSGGTDDSTAIAGLGTDFSKIIVGTSKDIYIVLQDETGADYVVPTRAKIGIINQQCIQSVPAYGQFPGGMMFLATDRTVRVLQGNTSLGVPVSIDNITTSDWGQNIRQTLNDYNLALCYGGYSNFKYYLTVYVSASRKYIMAYDIRTNAWTKHDYFISTQTSINADALFSYGNNVYYIEATDANTNNVMQMYQSTGTYRSVNQTSYLESPTWEASSEYKFINCVKFYYVPDTSVQSVLTITVTTDSNTYFTETYSKTIAASSSADVLDYFVVNVNAPVRWWKYTITATGRFKLRKIEVVGDPLSDEN